MKRKKTIFGALWGALLGILMLFIFGILCAIFEPNDWTNFSFYSIICLSVFAGIMAIIYYGVVVIPLAAFLGAWVGNSLSNNGSGETSSKADKNSEF